MTALAALLAGSAAAGVLVIVAALYGLPQPEAHPASPVQRRFARLFQPDAAHARGRRELRLRAALGLVAGLLVLVVVQVPAAGLAATAAVIGLPPLLRPSGAHRQIARWEALQDWTRSLAGGLRVGAGLEQALLATGKNPPGPIAPEVRRLCLRLEENLPIRQGLGLFADELADPLGDRVALALMLAVERRGRGLAATLQTLADDVQRKVAVRRRVEADRAKPRTTVRWVIIIELIFLLALLLFDRTLIGQLRTGKGQLAVVAATAMMGAAVWWMVRLVRPSPGYRCIPAEPGQGVGP
jgi:tight adherence protein B